MSFNNNADTYIQIQTSLQSTGKNKINVIKSIKAPPSCLVKGALCSFGDDIIIRRKISPLTDFLMPKQTR